MKRVRLNRRAARAWLALSDLPASVVAERVGFERSYFSRVIRGNHEVDRRLAVKLARILGCRLEQLLEEPSGVSYEDAGA